MTEHLTPEEGRTLLRVARSAIAAAVGAPIDGPPNPPAGGHLAEKRGVFVTIWKDGRLRGCIGHIRPDCDLMETTTSAARSAALRDPRFPPLSADELLEVALSVSVLTPPAVLSDPTPEAVEVGRHGIWITHGVHSGLLLPDVATRFEWSSETFLRETCRKAGLPGDAWTWSDASVHLFESQVFEELEGTEEG